MESIDTRITPTEEESSLLLAAIRGECRAAAEQAQRTEWIVFGILALIAIFAVGYFFGFSYGVRVAAPGDNSNSDSGNASYYVAPTSL